jgi:hypothetical protein
VRGRSRTGCKSDSPSSVFEEGVDEEHPSRGAKLPASQGRLEERTCHKTMTSSGAWGDEG